MKKLNINNLIIDGVTFVTKPKGFEKPVGVRDYLPYAVDKLRAIEQNVLDCMSRWGYRQIMTPTMEFYDTVGVASSTSDQKLFKLLNNRGTTLVLRSDMTSPIARVVSSLLKEEPLPIRLSYHANVFRAFEEEAGREAEFFQTGLELVGDDSPEADAEVVALAIASLKAAGVTSFKIAMGHVGFLNGLFEEVLAGGVHEQQMLKQHLLDRNYVGFRKAIRELELTISDSQRQELEAILRLRGGKEICDQAMALSEHELARSSINHLCKVWEVLELRRFRACIDRSDDDRRFFVLYGHDVRRLCGRDRFSGVQRRQVRQLAAPVRQGCSGDGVCAEDEPDSRRHSWKRGRGCTSGAYQV
ncbi:ATP phosphoribosyltransferase regulatory subunit [Paenibacillus sp. P1XP2]|nr:ATP phosphoribosyltransferase regulatory subunit [Paenibacillus sp. P1XP2]